MLIFTINQEVLKYIKHTIKFNQDSHYRPHLGDEQRPGAVK